MCRVATLKLGIGTIGMSAGGGASRTQTMSGGGELGMGVHILHLHYSAEALCLNEFTLMAPSCCASWYILPCCVS